MLCGLCYIRGILFIRIFYTFLGHAVVAHFERRGWEDVQRGLSRILLISSVHFPRGKEKDCVFPHPVLVLKLNFYPTTPRPVYGLDPTVPGRNEPSGDERSGWGVTPAGPGHRDAHRPGAGIPHSPGHRAVLARSSG